MSPAGGDMEQRRYKLTYIGNYLLGHIYWVHGKRHKRLSTSEQLWLSNGIAHVTALALSAKLTPIDTGKTIFVPLLETNLIEKI